MNLTIPLKDFLELLTYNQLFDYVDCPTEVGSLIELAIQKNHEELALQGVQINSIKPCHVEILDIGYCRVWYPMGSWINELKRREELQGKLTYAQEQSRKKDKQIGKLTELNSQLLQATMKGDKTLIENLLNEIAQAGK